MVVPQRPWIYLDLLDAPDDGVRREVIMGELIESRCFPRDHQVVSSNLLWILMRFLRASRLGAAFTSRVDVLLGPYDVVQPDIVVIRQERLGIYQPEGFVEGPPDIVVEITTPCSYQIDHVRKMALYAREGVPEYWVADAGRRAFAMHVLRDGVYAPIDATSGGTIPSLLFTGLHVEPTDVFAGLDDWPWSD